MTVRGREERFSLGAREMKQNLIFFGSKRDDTTAKTSGKGWLCGCYSSLHSLEEMKTKRKLLALLKKK